MNDSLLWTIISAVASVVFAVGAGLCFSRGDIVGVVFFTLYSGASLVMAALWGRRFDARRAA